MNLFHFYYFYNCKKEHTTAGKISKYACNNFHITKVREKVIITTENLKKKLYKIEEVVMIENWIHKIN